MSASASAQPGPPAAPPAEPAPTEPEPPGDGARDAEVFGGAAPPDEPAGEASQRDAARDTAVFGDPNADRRDASVFPGAPPAQGEGPAMGTARDAAILGDPGAGIELAQDAAPSDPLTIGGLMYLRSQGFLLQDQPARDWRVTVPTLTQVYFDVRPNERVRGFLQARLQYDPTLPASASAGSGVGGPVAPGGSSNGVQSVSAAFSSGTRTPRFTFDQLWINFDIDYVAFVTVGRQHVRWGTGRFWMPTDYLHLQNRNPIDVFDSRAGTNMVKLHVPVESLAWNFYAYAITETAQSATRTLSQIAGAIRGEFVVETAELGLGVFGRRGERPRGAVDLSFGVWDLDLYGELALRDGGEVDRVAHDPDAPPPTPEAPPSWQAPSDTALSYLSRVVDARYPLAREDGLQTQVVGGLTYAVRYDDDDVLTIGAEYFYNGLGYGTSGSYLGLLLPRSEPPSNAATFFYLGRHYGAVFVSLPAPFSLDLHTFTFSTLGNLSDGSYISRFDYAYTLLTHLRFEAFLAVHYGDRNGEFRFGIDPVSLGDVSFSQAPSLLDMGLALRLEY